MTLEFQNSISIQPTEEGGGGGGGDTPSYTITVPNLTFDTTSPVSYYPTLDVDGTYHPTSVIGWTPVKPEGALTSFHVHLKFTTGTIPQSGYYTMMGQKSGNYNPPQIEVENGKIHFITGSGSWSVWIEATPENNTTYTMDVTWDSASQKVVGTLLKEGETTPIDMEVGSGKTDVLTSYTWANYSTIGGETSSTWNGTIDLSDCYIEWNNGELRWDGLTTIDNLSDLLTPTFFASGGIH